ADDRAETDAFEMEAADDGSEQDAQEERKGGRVVEKDRELLHARFARDRAGPVPGASRGSVRKVARRRLRVLHLVGGVLRFLSEGAWKRIQKPADRLDLGVLGDEGEVGGDDRS